MKGDITSILLQQSSSYLITWLCYFHTLTAIDESAMYFHSSRTLQALKIMFSATVWRPAVCCVLCVVTHAITLPNACAIIPKLHSNPCDYLQSYIYS